LKLAARHAVAIRPRETLQWPAFDQSDHLTASEWTQQNMLSDVMQQKMVLIGAGCFIGALFLLSRRVRARRTGGAPLIRDFRHVDDAADVRDLLGENVPTILKPVLLSAVEELERQVARWFRQLEREINASNARARCALRRPGSSPSGRASARTRLAGDVFYLAP